MKKIICAILSLFLSLGPWVNAWTQQSGPSPNSATTQSFPKIIASPMSVNFGNLNPGGTTKNSVTIQNSGKSDLIISSITISGNNPSDFSQTNNCTTISAGGSCTVTVTFGPTSGGGKRSGILSITSNDPKKPTVNVKLSGNVKSPVCAYSLASSSQQCDASGGTWSVNVNAPNGCGWTAASKASWITITSGRSGTGNGTVTYTVTPNTGTRQRTGKMTIAKQTFTVSQSLLTCTYSISPTSQSFGSPGGTGSVSVTSPNGCNWAATSNASWITITSGGSGSGNGSVGYTVSASTATSQRTGTMTIAKQTFTVTQSPCLTPGTPSGPFPSDGPTGASSSLALRWSATSNTDFYDVYWGTSSNPPYVGNTTHTSYSLSGLTSDTTYFWKVVAKNNCGNSTSGPVWSFTTQTSNPTPVLSEYQQALLDNYGEPDYLSIAFNSAPPMREETWIYTEFQKMYLFWDGESLGATSITVDPNAYSNPPYLDPSWFTKDTTLADLKELLGSDYTEVDESQLSSVIGNADFKVYHFSDAGLFVAFLDGSLAAVQTIDIPESTGTLSVIKSLSGKEQKAAIDTNEVLASDQLTWKGIRTLIILGIAIYMLAGVNVLPEKPDPALTGCLLGLFFTNEYFQKCLTLALNLLADAAAKLDRSAPSGLKQIGQQADTMNAASTKCPGTSSTQATRSSAKSLSDRSLTAQASDQFPYCPGTATQCTGYTYSDWGPCGPDGNQTRQATKIPEGCNIEPAFPPEKTTQPCPSVTKTYSGGFSGSFSTSYSNGCTCDFSFSGTVTMTITFQYDGTYGGPFDVTGNKSWTCTSNDPHVTCLPGSCSLGGSGQTSGVSFSLTTECGTLAFTGAVNDTRSVIGGPLTISSGGSAGLTLFAQ
jgi:hypothetical protein